LQYSRSSATENGASSVARARQLREEFGLTQTELAQLSASVWRTVQNWEPDSGFRQRRS
jgi:DNA-binding transcriptional regulator YiaG